MKLRDFLSSDGLDRSRKRAALERLLSKLENTREKLEKDIAANSSGAKRRHLEIKLRTNRKQREKTVLLMEQLEHEDSEARPSSGWSNRRLLLS